MTDSTTREPLIGAVALGISAAIIARRGGFYLPDLLVLPIVLGLGAAFTRERPVGADLGFGLATITFAAVWVGRGVQTGTADRALSLAGAAVALVATYLIGRRVGIRGAFVERALVVISSGTNLAALLGWAVRRQPLGLVFDGAWRLAGSFAYPNTAGLFAALAAIVSVGTSAVAPRAQRMATVVAVAALVVSVSRGGLLGLAVGLVVLGWRRVRGNVFALGVGATVGLYGVATARSGDPQPEFVLMLIVAMSLVALPLTAVFEGQTWRRIWRPVLTVGVVTLIAFGGGATSSRVLSIARERSGTASMEDRAAEWTAAWRAGVRQPIVGSGPELELLIYNFRGTATARYAHNEPLQVFAGAGIVGVVPLAIALATGWVALRRRRRRSRIAVAAATIMVLGGLIDFHWHFVGLTAFAGWLLALDDPGATGADESGVAPAGADSPGRSAGQGR